jgi:hypothetical protein
MFATHYLPATDEGSGLAALLISELCEKNSKLNEIRQCASLEASGVMGA